MYPLLLLWNENKNILVLCLVFFLLVGPIFSTTCHKRRFTKVDTGWHSALPGLLWISMVTKITLHVEIGIYRCLNSFKPLSQLKENEVVTQISAFLQQFQQSIFPKWGGKSRSKSLLLVLPRVIVHYSNKNLFPPSQSWPPWIHPHLNIFCDNEASFSSVSMPAIIASFSSFLQ